MRSDFGAVGVMSDDEDSGYGGERRMVDIDASTLSIKQARARRGLCVARVVTASGAPCAGLAEQEGRGPGRPAQLAEALLQGGGR